MKAAKKNINIAIWTHIINKIRRSGNVKTAKKW